MKCMHGRTCPSRTHGWNVYIRDNCHFSSCGETFKALGPADSVVVPEAFPGVGVGVNMELVVTSKDDTGLTW